MQAVQNQLLNCAVEVAASGLPDSPNRIGAVPLCQAVWLWAICWWPWRTCAGRLALRHRAWPRSQTMNGVRLEPLALRRARLGRARCDVRRALRWPEEMRYRLELAHRVQRSQPILQAPRTGPLMTMIGAVWLGA